MSDETYDDLEQQLQREQIDRLALNVRVFLRQGRVAEAQAAIDDLRKLNPESAEAWELQGDLYRRQGDRKGAREAYQTAFKLDPTNAGAERKYAEVVLFLGEEDRARRQQRELVDDPAKRPTKRRNPTLAVIYACLFPGLGQLYNRHHEKGLLLVVIAILLLAMLANAVIFAPWDRAKQGATNWDRMRPISRLHLWGDALRAMPWWHWVLVVLGLLAFVSMHIYAIVDAAVVARREAKEADRLGIDVPA